jgi:uncharacterized protein YkwD
VSGEQDSRDPVRLVAVLAMIAAFACERPAAPEPGVGTSGALSGPGARVVELVNAQRTRVGVSSLRANVRLTRAAQIHADQIAAAGRLEHRLARARYPRLEDRLAAAGYRWRAIGENLASGQPTAAQAVAGWLSSSAHRANMLNTTFTETGAAVAFDDRSRSYYVQVFARPSP